MRRPFGVVTDQGRVVAADLLDRYVVKSHSRQLPEQQAFEGIDGLLRPRFDPATLVGVLDLSTAHARACQQKALDVVGGGWRWDRVEEAAVDTDRARVEAFFAELPAPANALDDDDLGDVFASAQLDYETVGRGALELVREDHAADGPLATVAHMPAHELRVHRDKRRFLQLRGGLRRWFKWVSAPVDVDWESGQEFELGVLPPERRATEVLWWRQYHPADKVYGLPDVIPALGAVHGDVGRRDYNIEFFSNFGIPAYAVFVSGDFDPGKMVDSKGNVVDDESPDAVMTEAEWHIQQLLAEVRKNPHSSLVFTVPTRDDVTDGKVEIRFEPLATDVKEASFRLYRRDNREEVLSAHGMSSAIAGVFDAGVANRESMAHYQRSVVAPRRRKLAAAVNRYIVRAFGVSGWRWVPVGMDARDTDRELDTWLKLFHAGGVTMRTVLAHTHELLGILHPGPPTGDPVLDELRPAGAPADQPAGGDDTAAALRSMRDDLVAMASKQHANGHRLGALV